MLYFAVAFIFIISLGLLFWAMTTVYKIKPRTHNLTPAESGIDFKEVRFKTKGDLNLYGWWIPHSGDPEQPVLILVHGWKRNAERMLPYIEMLHENYNLLAFDSRSHGSSDEDSYSSMPRFAEDIMAAVDFVRSEFRSIQSLGILGLSMGGAAAIYAASKDKRINAVVTVGAFAHPADVMRLEFKKRHIPYFPMVWLLFEYIQYLMKARFNNFAPEKNIYLSEASFMLIHGKEDKTAPVEQAERLYKAAKPENAKLWMIDEMGHSNCHEHPEMKSRLLDFLQSNLK